MRANIMQLTVLLQPGVILTCMSDDVAAARDAVSGLAAKHWCTSMLVRLQALLLRMQV